VAVRTTESAVKALLGLDYDAKRKRSVLVHVQSAAAVVDDLVSYAADEGITFDSARRELVERWLACWFYTAVDPLYSQRSTLGVSGGFLRGKDEYKERASALDPTGALDALLAQNVGTMTWGGKSPTEATDYEDRR
jgi:hypothetical protein